MPHNLRFLLAVALAMVVLGSYMRWQESQYHLNAFAVKCQKFGGEVNPPELVPAYSKPLCLKRGMLFALD